MTNDTPAHDTPVQTPHPAPEPQATSQAPAASHSSRFTQWLRTPTGKAVGVIVVVAALLCLVTWQAYARPVTDPFVRTVSTVLPYPALRVNGQTLTIKEFLVEYDALSEYFNSLQSQQGAPPADQLEVAIADTLVNKLAIKQLAKQYGVEVDEGRMEAYYQQVVSSQGGEEAFAQDLTETFGWTIDEFKERIVESIVLALQMSEVVLADTELQQVRRDLVAGAYGRVQAGEDFSVIANDIHAGFGGLESDLGYVNSSMIPEGWASQVMALEQGQTTEVIELPEGYAIFKLEERITAGEDTQLHLLSITVPKYSLEEVVDEYLETANVKRYVGQV